MIPPANLLYGRALSHTRTAFVLPAPPKNNPILTQSASMYEKYA